MPLRRSVLRSAAAVLTAVAASLTLVSASHADDTSAASSSESAQPENLGSSRATHSAWDESTIEINALDRSASGRYTQLVWTLHNRADEYISLNAFENTTYWYPGATNGSGLVLFDEENEIRYHPYIDTEQDCVCAGADHAPTRFRLFTQPGTQNTYWASYQLSEDTDSVTVEIPGFLPIQDVPVS
ncbi:hypothetical protein [Marinactinospora rubrisoli]|uniref:DUF4352 domain-containing protein n=1 Tax=Marinactinospora rubrisoli TaxID=2715399 RepID=A0ABW2KIJ7_9ACTN